MKELQENAMPNLVIGLVGNKADLEESRMVDSMDAEVYADDNVLIFGEVSAKTGQGIYEIFITLGKFSLFCQIFSKVVFFKSSTVTQ